MNIGWYICQASSDRQALLTKLTHEHRLSIIPNCFVQCTHGVPFYTFARTPAILTSFASKAIFLFYKLGT